MISRNRSFLRAAMAGLLLSMARVSAVVAPAGVDEGEVLLGELNCTACHTAGAAVEQRLSRPGAPLLAGEDAIRSSTAWLRRWLAAPHAVKPGAGMPDMLAGVPATERAAVADTLVHFLVSIRSAAAPPGLASDAGRVEQGRRLYHSLGCVACHAPDTKPDGVSDETFAKVRAASAPLGELARKYPAGELVRFLRDPLRHRPGGRMPSLGLDAAEAEAVALYLLREQTPAPGEETTSVGGLRYDYYEGDFGNIAALLAASPKSSGDSPKLELKTPHPDNGFGVRFVGRIDIPADGEYRFWLTSDDGSRLRIDGRTVVDNDGNHGEEERTEKLRLTRGLHALEVLFFQGGGGYAFKAEWRPPGGKRGPIPPELLKREGRPLAPVDAESFVLDPAKAEAGRRHFDDLNCMACHALPELPARPARPLAELAGRTQAGCLADAPPPRAPRYDLSPERRAALRRAVADTARLSRPLAASEQVAHTMTRLDCFACHARDGVGGPLPSGRDAWFSVVGEADLGDEGRIPPHLDGAGAKLRETALNEILAKGAKARPYMATRMPVFGPASAALAPLLKQADRRPDAQSTPAHTVQDAKNGWKLVGREGVSCVSCHTFTTHGSLGIPALALDRMGARLEWDWLRRYLPDPAALRPGTRMPSFWPEGRAVNRAILDGDTDAQIRAVFAYLADGPKAEVPSGLIRGRKEIIVDQEPVIYRNFIEGAGPRAIGVGYPEHANLAYDAQSLRLALIWQGPFIDMARHSTDRGVGYEPPLGDHRVKLPDGPAFAVLRDPDAPWPAADKADGRFLGYRLDAARRPSFRVAVGGLEITETPLPRPGPVDMTLVRTFRAKAGTPGDGRLWLRVAKGAISRKADAHVVDGVLHIVARGPEGPRIVGDELRVPIDPGADTVVEMTW